MFDYIIIDAPPLGIFTDASVLMNRADAALLVVRAGKTKYSVVDKLLEQIPRERMLGVVLNRAEEQPHPSSYYYHRRYYNRDRNGGKPKEVARRLKRRSRSSVESFTTQWTHSFAAFGRGFFDLWHNCRSGRSTSWNGWCSLRAYYEVRLLEGRARYFFICSLLPFDLYDFVVMHDRRELVLRLVQALGLAWLLSRYRSTRFQRLRSVEASRSSRCHWRLV